MHDLDKLASIISFVLVWILFLVACWSAASNVHEKGIIMQRNRQRRAFDWYSDESRPHGVDQIAGVTWHDLVVSRRASHEWTAVPFERRYTVKMAAETTVQKRLWPLYQVDSVESHIYCSLPIPFLYFFLHPSSLPNPLPPGRGGAGRGGCQYSCSQNEYLGGFKFAANELCRSHWDTRQRNSRWWTGEWDEDKKLAYFATSTQR